METTQIVPIVIAIIASTPGILALISESRKTKVDAVKVSQDAAIAIINPLRDELARLRTRVCDLETMIEKKDARISDLETRLLQRNIDIGERDQRIDDLETEVADLRLRLEAVEKNGNGGSK
jgi:uncharacterized protein (DUF3084 family)